MRGLRSGTASIVLLGLAPACKVLNPDFDGPASSSAGSGATSRASATSDPSSSTLTTMPSDGSMGGSATSLDGPGSSTSDVSPCQGDMCLTDRGLLVRYFIDEADSGQRPAVLFDSVDPPLDLLLTYGPELSFTEQATGRGLDWTTFGQDSRASVLVDGTKIADALQGATTATIELVLRMGMVHELGSRISHIGNGSERGRFTLSSIALGVLELHWQGGTLLEQWDLGTTLTERRVVHVVLDTEAADPAARAQLFIDGSLVDPIMEIPPGMGETIDLDIDRHYALGNRQIGGRTFEGTMFYAALYDSALTLDEVADHTAVLAAFDDAP